MSEHLQECPISLPHPCFLEKEKEKLIFKSTPYPFPIFWQLANRPASCVKMHAAFLTRIVLPRAFPRSRTAPRPASSPSRHRPAAACMCPWRERDNARPPLESHAPGSRLFVLVLPSAHHLHLQTSIPKSQGGKDHPVLFGRCSRTCTASAGRHQVAGRGWLPPVSAS